MANAHCEDPESLRVGSNQGVDVRLLAEIGLTTPPSVLKMDIEGFEWEILEQIVRSHALMPVSLTVELHYKSQFPKVPFHGRFLSPFEMGAWADFMFTRGGYVLVDRRDHSVCLHCCEVVFARLVEPGLAPLQQRG